MWDEIGLDDATLTQIANQIEKDEKLWDDSSNIDDNSLTQLMKIYDVSHNTFMNFDLGGESVLSTMATTPADEAPHRTRFAEPTSVDEMAALVNDTDSKATRRNTTWAKNLFSEWRNHRNNLPGNCTPIPTLDRMTDVELDNNLSLFIMEIRKNDGSQYPGKTLYCITTGIRRHLCESGAAQMTILNEKDHRFSFFSIIWTHLYTH